MNILHVCSYYENTLYESLVHALGERKIENEVYIFLSKEKENIPFKNTNENIVLSYCYNKFDRCFFHRKHKKVLEDFYEKYNSRICDFDVIYAHSLFSNGYIAYRAKQKWGIPYIVMVQNTDMNVFFKYMKNLHMLGINILKEADRIVFASHSYVDEIFEKYIPKKMEEEIKSKISVVPYGINDYYFKNNNKSGYINDGIVILSVADICRNKNHLLLARAVEYLRILRKQENIRLIIIGGFQDRGIVEKLQKYSFVKCVDFIEKEELIDYYHNADVFALVSKTETFGLVYAEALSQGCPIIYSKGQGFDQQFEEGLVGYHVNSKSYQDVAVAIDKLLNNDIPKETCKDCADKFKWSMISNSYYKIFEEIIKQREL